MRIAKTLIRLGGCPGRSESSLGAQPHCWFCHIAAQFCFRHDDLKGQEIQIVTTTTTIRPVGGAEGLVLGGTTFRAGVCVLTMLLLMVT